MSLSKYMPSWHVCSQIEAEAEYKYGTHLRPFLLLLFLYTCEPNRMDIVRRDMHTFCIIIKKH